MTKHILFHYPGPLCEEGGAANTGERIRPVRMLRAFRELGYEVDVVAGHVRERRTAIRNAVSMMRDGKRYRFMYAESSAMPTALTEPSHFPRAPFLDAHFFAAVRQQGVPIGLFYRDIYWRFAHYRATVGRLKSMAARPFFLHDLRWYKRTLKRLYLPSLPMSQYLASMPHELFAELPPGGEPEAPAWPIVSPSRGKLHLLYVGGLGSHYQMHVLVEAVSQLPEVSLTICSRASEWAAVRSEYAQWMSPNIQIVHRSGAELDSLYLQCDVAAVFVEPDEYRRIASPVKVYEYLSRHRPVLASDGTHAGRFVTDNGVGWTIPYDVRSVSALLESLRMNPAEVAFKSETCARLAPAHTWKARAQQVADELSGSPRNGQVSASRGVRRIMPELLAKQR